MILRKLVIPTALLLALATTLAFRTSVDDAKKKAADDYRANYVATTINEATELGWTGDVKRCKPGKLSQAAYDKLLKRINYFRRLAGVSDQVVLDSGWNKLAQSAALIMHANSTLDHSPHLGMKCYSKEGFTGASSSNLSTIVPSSFPLLIADQIEDHGGSNGDCGHRRWLLRAGSLRMGIGACPEAYAVRVFAPYDEKNYETSFTTKNLPEYYSYPGKGYMPFQVVYRRWTFSIPEKDGQTVDFKAARVSVKAGDKTMPCALESRTAEYGDPGIVWAMTGIQDDFDYDYGNVAAKKTAYAKKGLLDKTVTVTVSNVKVNGEAKTYTYSFIIFDPDEVK